MDDEYSYEQRKDQAIRDCLRLLNSHLDGMESTHTVGELYALCLAVRNRLEQFDYITERIDVL